MVWGGLEIPYMFEGLVIMRQWIVNGEKPRLFVCECVFYVRQPQGRSDLKISFSIVSSVTYTERSYPLSAFQQKM